MKLNLEPAFPLWAVFVELIVVVVIFLILFSCTSKGLVQYNYEYIKCVEVELLNPIIECPICGERMSILIEEQDLYHKCGAKLFRVDDKLYIYNLKGN